MGTAGRREAREDSAEGPGSPGAESETFRTRTCWSQHCHCSLRGTGQRDHRDPHVLESALPLFPPRDRSA